MASDARDPQLNRHIRRIGQEFKAVYIFLKNVLFKITHLADDTDVEGTISGIRNGVNLEGSNLWVLICSSMIACIGLDINSPAVIIGAMLISPLMSPILGIGLSAGINDRDLLFKSFRSFGVAIFLTLAVAVIYFKISPLAEFTPEMQGRIRPTILDAFVALFGGLAGIIAGSRTEKTNAIPGVAIATALMPPLCTSGYGLATGNYEIFGGAFYLFFINAVLISVSTYVIVRVLKFPFIQDVDEKKHRGTRRVVSFFIFLLLMPSFWFLFQTLQGITEKGVIEDFISKKIHKNVEKGVDWTYKAEPDSTYVLEVYYFGNYIHPDSVFELQNQLAAGMKDHLILFSRRPKACRIDLTATKGSPDEMEKIVSDIEQLKSGIYNLDFEQRTTVRRVRSETDSLRNVIVQLTGDSIPFHEISGELKAIYPEMKNMMIGRSKMTDFDSLPGKNSYSAVVRWDKKMRYRGPELKQRIASFLKVKLKADTVLVVNY